MTDPAFRYEQKALLNTQVANPFRNYLTPDKFPGQLRNTATVTLGSLLVPYPQYGDDHADQHQRQATLKTQTSSCARSGRSPTASASWWPMPGTTRSVQEWFDDIAQLQGADRPRRGRLGVAADRHAGASLHRRPSRGRSRSGKGQAVGSDMHDRARLRCSAAGSTPPSGRFYSGRPVFFNTSYVVSGNPSSTTRRATSGSTPACSRCRTRSRRAATRGTTTG